MEELFMGDGEEKRVRLFDVGDGVSIDVASEESMASVDLDLDEVREMHDWLGKVLKKHGE